MEFIVSASTDAGNIKTENQDSVSIQLLKLYGRQVVFAVLCDGMGGLQRGELASTSVIYAFRRWKESRLPSLLQGGLQDTDIRREWTQIIESCNERIKCYGAESGVMLGTTAVVLLLTENRYYVANVGDSRLYELRENTRQITRDHTLVARDIECGVLRPDQAESDPRRNVLLQCIGASQEVYPDFFFGVPSPDTVYMLCSDGFRHEVTSQEMFEGLSPCRMNSMAEMKANEEKMIRLIKERGERDNITVATIRTYA